ncbi:MAG TPA: SDR family NAD(P)-dependent oxidoreductase [Spirochaetia bacterium]|nr:SDR family NAD(P)-dependent oxidoreductase [Spirochaetia bacterium]
MQTKGNTVLITGGTSGIGRAFAQQFAARGNRVIICGRRAERLAQTEKENTGVVGRVCDVSLAEDREELARWAQREFPDLNFLINNAGVQLAADLTHPVDLARIHTEIETNLVAPIHLTSLFAAHLSEKKSGAIINISSGLAFAPIAFMPVYCATKAAVHSMTLSLRHQLRTTSVKVFEIAPPGVDTELGHERRSDRSQSHGGMPVAEFIAAAMEAIESDVLEAAIGPAAGMRANPAELFARMNA